MTTRLPSVAVALALVGCPPPDWTEEPTPDEPSFTTNPVDGSASHYRRNPVRVTWTGPHDEVTPRLFDWVGVEVPTTLSGDSIQVLTPMEPLDAAAEYGLDLDSEGQVQFWTSRLGLPLSGLAGKSWQVFDMIVQVALDEPLEVVVAPRWGDWQTTCLPTARVGAELVEDGRMLRFEGAELFGMLQAPIHSLELSMECDPAASCIVVEGSRIDDVRGELWWSSNVDQDCSGCFDCGEPSPGPYCDRLVLDRMPAPARDIDLVEWTCASVLADPACSDSWSLWDPDGDGYPQLCPEALE